MRVVATAGHVDHGKSSLVLALTGTDPDRFAEEQRRGLTIDLGFAHTTLPSGAGISLVDVPGHVRFLRNMLAGVGGVDACLFVVAATEGWKPQSEEHLRILELIGIRHGIVALTKCDLVDDDWLTLQTMDVQDHLAGTFLGGAPIVAVSGTTGAGMDDLRAALDALVAEAAPSPDRGRARLWVDRVFAARGSGTVVTGTLTGGRVATDDRLTVTALDRDVRIRGMQSLGRSFDEIGPGNRVALNLVGVDHGEMGRGDVIVRADQWRPTERFDASLEVLVALDHDVSRRGAYVAYIGAGEWPVRMRVLGPDRIAPGASGLVRLHLSTPLPLVPGDRFVLRESGRSETVGGGEVLDIAPILPASKARPDRRVDRVVAERGWVADDDLAALIGAPTDHVLAAAPTLRRVGSWIVGPAAFTTSRDSLIERATSVGTVGVDLAVLDERERAIVSMIDELAIDKGRVVLAGSVDPVADHPLIEALRAGGVNPPDPGEIDRTTVRELVRRGHVVERDGILFHPDAIDHAARTAAAVLTTLPDGFTMSAIREALGTSRKYAVPLMNELDARGVTRRRGDLRIGGPRLPAS